ncbi:MAG: helix-turn-helix domain-containing protein [Desulfobaccales bacterium]|jgi:excisionase family DNA binding protein
MTEKLLTPEDAAKILVVEAETVRSWLRDGKLKGVKMGRLWRVKESDLGEFLKSLAQGPISVGASIHLADQEDKEIGPGVMGSPATLPGGPVKE